MKTIDDFVALVGDELGLVIDREDVGRHLDEVAGWDSVLLLGLLTALERETGRRVPFADVLEATSLERIYALAVGA
ncbi:phosphopantetheine-binding protein [Saccharothrix syringae]|uniref:phosphopantetheine-binding protein n=1 Tax=Saccharothrix syringae TaxID=103733 RepID=UPI000526A061|nr:phosphopantetheine-binding protein [Saccharothrix syringae]